MRPLELALVIGLIPCVVHLLSPWRLETPWIGLLWAAPVLLLLSHLVVEGYRWHMFPAYAVVLFLLVYPLARFAFTVQISYLAGALALLFVMSAIVLSTIAPVFALPAPTGPYRVGTLVRHLVDTSRVDPQSDKPGGPRELMIQIWYPVDSSARGSLARYRDRALTNFRNARLALVKTHSLEESPVSMAMPRYPVLIFAPSWWGQRTENTYQSEELASHGYIVVGVDHPYSTSATAFPDGRIALTKLLVDEDYSSEARVEVFLKAVDEQLKIRTQDVKFVLDSLEQFDSNDPAGLLTGRLDRDRVGILGFSFGGTVAAELCWQDRRFRAGVDMDGMLAGESAQSGTYSRFLFMLAKDTADLENIPVDASPAERREIEFDRKQYRLMEGSLSKSGGYWVTIAGTSHSNFSDVPFFSPLRRQTHAGPIDRDRGAQIIRSYLVSFFDRELKGIDESLLSGESPGFPEVGFKAWAAERVH